MAWQRKTPQSVYTVNDKNQVELHTYKMPDGLSYEQQIEMLQQQVQKDTGKHMGEVSTKGWKIQDKNEPYSDLSAMRLVLGIQKQDPKTHQPYQNLCLMESFFQASKKFDGQGAHPEWVQYQRVDSNNYRDLDNARFSVMNNYKSNAFDCQKSAKQLQHQGIKFHGFNADGFDFPGEPKTWFYDYTYCMALHQKQNAARPANSNSPRLKPGELARHGGAFNDIFFDPSNSVNCQARACAIYQALDKRGILKDAMKNPINFRQAVYESDLLANEQNPIAHQVDGNAPAQNQNNYQNNNDNGYQNQNRPMQYQNDANDTNFNVNLDNIANDMANVMGDEQPSQDDINELNALDQGQNQGQQQRQSSTKPQGKEPSRVFVSGSMSLSPQQGSELGNAVQSQLNKMMNAGSHIYTGDSSKGIDSFVAKHLVANKYQNVTVGTVNDTPRDFNFQNGAVKYNWQATQVLSNQSGINRQRDKDRWLSQQSTMSLGFIEMKDDKGRFSSGTMRNMIQSLNDNKPTALYYVTYDKQNQPQFSGGVINSIDTLDKIVDSFHDNQISTGYQRLKAQEAQVNEHQAYQVRPVPQKMSEHNQNYQTFYGNSQRQGNQVANQSAGFTNYGNSSNVDYKKPVNHAYALNQEVDYPNAYPVKTDIPIQNEDSDQNRMIVAFNQFKMVQPVDLHDGLMKLNQNGQAPFDTSFNSVKQLGNVIPSIKYAIERGSLNEQTWNQAMHISNNEFASVKNSKVAEPYRPHILTSMNPNYPQNQLHVADKRFPNVFYAVGNIKALNAPRLATFIGPREKGVERKNEATGQSRAGEMLGVDMGKALIKNGTVLVGGFATGTDATGYKLSMAMHQPTIQIISSPVDKLNKIYPPKNQKDIQPLLENGGCFLSKEPLNSHLPQMDSDAFRKYNSQKLIERDAFQSGISDFTFAVEGARDSGTRYAMQDSLQQNRPIATLDWQKYRNDPTLKDVINDTKPTTYAWDKMSPNSKFHQIDKDPQIYVDGRKRPQLDGDISLMNDYLKMNKITPLTLQNLKPFLKQIDELHQQRFSQGPTQSNTPPKDSNVKQTVQKTKPNNELDFLDGIDF